ncbi:hypothetical protein BDP81DRAFT_87826 [Colletotrichum phormii]|uniref:Uncharacterized protein n=1 Tax=Colletotrichum phormii TaxID=359342 RepID=A0AAJ0EIZ6_9PEZI|nr:uncharacterized protein BDP81DRAFT_87826 [Colletotrichum phormii]KAK1654735.1 hypothetical protein BDP81DRAFT_87826 [Colletotrichum phormii]
MKYCSMLGRYLSRLREVFEEPSISAGQPGLPSRTLACRSRLVHVTEGAASGEAAGGTGVMAAPTFQVQLFKSKPDSVAVVACHPWPPLKLRARQNSAVIIIQFPRRSIPFPLSIFPVETSTWLLRTLLCTITTSLLWQSDSPLTHTCSMNSVSGPRNLALNTIKSSLGPFGSTT